MALRHQLSLNIVDGCNPTNFTIIDTSNYTNAPITCPTLGITMPGAGGAIYYVDPTQTPGSQYYPLPDVLQVDCSPCPPCPPGTFQPYIGKPKFNYTIDNLFLKIQPPGETLSALPDGLWTISYCVAPCDKLGVEYYYLRITSALNQYAGLLCKLRLSNCLPSEETLKMIDELHVIKMYLDAAKARVEVCHAPNEGVALYEYALRLMANWEKTCCSTC